MGTRTPTSLAGSALPLGVPEDDTSDARPTKEDIMARRLLRVSVLTMLTFALVLGGGSAGPTGAHTDPRVAIMALLGAGPSEASAQPELVSTIAFASSRDNDPARMSGDTRRAKLTNTAEIYLMPMKADGTQGLNPPVQRLTNDTTYDAFPVLSPDGKKIVFDSSRRQLLGPEEPPLHLCPGCTNWDIVDLFVMNADGSDQRHLTRGGSSTISPHGNFVAYQDSASRTQGPYKTSLSAATWDGDIFVLNIDDCLKVIERFRVDDCRDIPGEHVKNITNSPDYVEEDPEWSPILPDGTQKIVYQRHPLSDNVEDDKFATQAEIFVVTVNPNGTPVQDPQQLTYNSIEERAPDWSKDGARIAFMARVPSGVNRDGPVRSEIFVMNADGTNRTQLTVENRFHASPTWSPVLPDGTQKIVFDKGQTTATLQLYLMTITTNPDGTVGCVGGVGTCVQMQLTDDTVDANVSPNWGMQRVHVKDSKETQPSNGAPAAAPASQPRGR